MHGPYALYYPGVSILDLKYGRLILILTWFFLVCFGWKVCISWIYKDSRLGAYTKGPWSGLYKGIEMGTQKYGTPTI